MRRLLAPAMLLPGLVSAAALAQEPEHRGMPQLDFANPLTISQIVWLVVIFAVMYVLLSRWALPKVGRVLGERATRVANDLDSARAAKSEADAAAREVREASRRSRAEAQEQIIAAVEQAKLAAADQSAQLNAALEARLTQSEQAIGSARATAMAGLAEVATDAATSIIARLAGKPADPATVASAVGALLEHRTA